MIATELNRNSLLPLREKDAAPARSAATRALALLDEGSVLSNLDHKSSRSPACAVG